MNRPQAEKLVLALADAGAKAKLVSAVASPGRDEGGVAEEYVRDTTVRLVVEFQMLATEDEARALVLNYDRLISSSAVRS